MKAEGRFPKEAHVSHADMKRANDAQETIGEKVFSLQLIGLSKCGVFDAQRFRPKYQMIQNPFKVHLVDVN